MKNRGKVGVLIMVRNSRGRVRTDFGARELVAKYEVHLNKYRADLERKFQQYRKDCLR